MKKTSKGILTKIILGIVAVAIVGWIVSNVHITKRNADTERNLKIETEKTNQDDAQNTNMVQEVEQKETKTEETEETEVSEEETECFKVLSEYMVAADWNEETYEGSSIEVTEYYLMGFINMLSNDNYSEDGKYSAYLPEMAENNNDKIEYTEQSIKDYVRKVFGLQITGNAADGFTFENGKYRPIDMSTLYSKKSEIKNVDIDGSTYHVSGIVTFGENLDASQYGDYMASYQFEMVLEKNEDSPIGFKFQDLKYDLYERLGDTEYDDSQTDNSENYMLSGEYESNRDATLWFEEDGSVRVSEGGSNTICSYSIDADGNLIIYANSENLEGKYDAEQDCIRLYGKNFYRH